MAIRTLIILVCYLSSGQGIFLSISMALVLLSEPLLGSILALAIFYAWCVHVVMSAAWIFNRKLQPVWPLSGAVAGVLSIALVPAGATFENVPMPLRLSYGDFGFMLMFLSVPVLPCLILAFYLVWYHIRKEVPQTNVTNR